MIRSHQSSVISHVAALLRDRTRCMHLISLFCSSPDDNRDTSTSNAPPLQPCPPGTSGYRVAIAPRGTARHIDK